jgi:hypothetical protein
MIDHRRQMLLQVYLPLGLFALLLAALVAWLWMGGVGDAGTWADVALILLLIPAMLMGLVILAAFIALAVLIVRLIGIIPEPAHRAQSIIRRVERETSRSVDLALRPLLTLSALWAAFKAICKGLISIIGIK